MALYFQKKIAIFLFFVCSNIIKMYDIVWYYIAHQIESTILKIQCFHVQHMCYNKIQILQQILIV